MNQILYEDIQTPKTDINKILLFFAVALIVFGLILVGSGIWGLVSKPEEIPLNNGTKPQVETSVFEDDQVSIKVTHDKAIDKILYNWNGEADIEIPGRQRSSFEELIEMPIGENVLSLRVIDIAGQETRYTQSYVLSAGVDIQKPTIELSVVDSNIKIIAQDETEISYITYRWNNQEEARVDVTDGSKTIIETSIPIIRGENDLTVIAVDANNNTETKIEKFRAVTQPKIEVSQYADKLTIRVTDEEGLDRVEYNLNGQNFRWVSTTEDRTEWIHEQEIPVGDTTIIINAWNKQQVQAEEFRGRCNYTP